MRKLLKRSLIILALLLLALLTAAVTLSIVIDPNDYKDEIMAQVKQHTGRELIIKGDIAWAFFPRLGVQLGEMTLGNARGFQPATFAQIDALKINVKVLPLLTGRIEIGKVELTGLRLNLQRNKLGVTNWDDLLHPAPTTTGTASEQTAPVTPKPAGSSSAPSAIAALAIAGVEIRQARISWDDQQTGQNVRLEKLQLQLGKFALNTPIPLNTEFDLIMRNPELTGHVRLAMQATLDVHNQRYQLAELYLGSQLNSPLLPGSQLDSTLQSKLVQLDLQQQTLTSNQITLQVMGVNLHTNVSASQIIDAPRFSASFSVDPFAPRALADKLDISLPAMADPNALQTAQLSGELRGNLQQLQLDNLYVQLDDSELNGELTLANFSAPAIAYNLAINQIDIDRYLPPPATTPANSASTAGSQSAASPATVAATQTALLPVDLLRSLNLDGTLRIARLKAMNLHSTDIRITSQAKQGRIRLYPLGAQLYDGNYSGDIQIDASGKTPRLNLNEALTGVQIGPLLKDLWGDDFVRGQANLSARLNASGNTELDIRKTLNGHSEFLIKDGEIKDLDMAQVQKAVNEIDDDFKAVIGSIKNPAEFNARLEATRQKWKNIRNPAASNATYFSDISGTLQVSNGIASNRDLKVRLPFGRVRGEGEVDLVKLSCDYTAYVKLTSKAEVQSGKTYEQLDRVPVRIFFKGPLNSLSPELDYGGYASELAKQALKEQEQKLKQKVEKKVDEKLQRETDKLKDKLENKLRDLLKF